MRLIEKANWTGSDFDQFKKGIKEVAESTSMVSYRPSEIVLMTLVDEDEDALYLDSHVPGGVIRRRRLSKKTLNEKGIPTELIDEMRANKLMVLLGNKVTAFTSPNFIATLAPKVKLSGEGLFEPSEKRDAYISERLHDTSADINVILREHDDAVKAFAAHSSQYPYIPQTVLLDIIKKIEKEKSGLGEMKTVWWEINHSISSIYIEFPEFAEDVSATYGLPETVIPGIRLLTSDIGDSSVSCIGTWNVRGCNATQSVYKRRHRGALTIDEIVVEIDKEVFSLYRKVPEKLAELLTINIPDPVSAISEAVSKIGFKVLGKKIAVELEEALSAEIDSTRKYTAYDLATSILTIPSRVSGVSETNVSKMSEMVLKAVFLDWNKIKSAGSKVVLTS